MRLLGVGLLTLLLIGTLVILGQSGAFDSAVQRFSNDETVRFDDSDLASYANFDVEGRDVFAAPMSIDGPVILSGLPSYANLAFIMPSSQRPQSGVLEIAFTSRVADGLEGALRVTINGTRRADYLLSQGRADGRVEVELSPQDLSAAALNVGVSLQGRGPIAECSVDDAVAAVVEIAGETGLRLSLGEPATTAGDRLALWGGRVPVQWTNGMDESARAGRIYSASLLFSKGYRPLFVDDGLSGEALMEFAAQAVPNRLYASPQAYPVALTGDPANRGARQFTRRVNWRYSYRSDDMPGGILPRALDLRMQIGPATDDLRRDLTIMLNDRLLVTRRLEGDLERLNQSIIIPESVHQFRNTLNITVTASDAAELRCGEIAPSSVELLPETVLRPGQAGDSGPLADLRGALRSASNVTVESDMMTIPDAEAGARLLARLAPGNWRLANNSGGARIRLLTGADISSLPAVSRTARNWIVYSEGADTDAYVARRADRRGAETLPPAVALLITLPSELISSGERDQAS